MKSIANLADDLGVTPAIIRSWQINLNLQHPRYSPDKAVYNSDWQQYFQEVARLRKQGLSFSKIRSLLQTQKPDAGDLPALELEVESATEKDSRVFEPQSEAKNESIKPAQPLHFSVVSPERAPLSTSEAPSPRPVNQSQTSYPAAPSFASGQALSANQSLVQMDSHLPSMQHLQHNMHEALLQQDMSKMAQTYVQLMENYQTLANRYNESAYIMGQLEEKNRSLEQLMHEKERHFEAQEGQKQAQVNELENHLQTLQKNIEQRDQNLGELKSSLEQREQSLEQHQQQLVTKDEVSQLEKQLKLLALSIFKQQEKTESAAELGFWQRMGRRFRK